MTAVLENRPVATNVKTPKTCNLKQSCSSTGIQIQNSAKLLFQKVMSKTPKANKFLGVSGKTTFKNAFKQSNLWVCNLT